MSEPILSDYAQLALALVRAVGLSASGKDMDKLYFPNEIAEDIGSPAPAINAMKDRGCPFSGRKTTIRWVREFLAREAGAIPGVSESQLNAAHLSARK